MTTELLSSTPAPSPVVCLDREGRLITTSADVAAFFGKSHRHVLRDINKLLDDLRHLDEAGVWRPGEAPPDPDLGGEHAPKIGLMSPDALFVPTTVEVPIGQGGVRRDPAYSMSRDGFALLAMGFTGRQALAFKLAYISAFNALEAKVRELHVAPLPSDREFTRGIRMKDKLVLQEQGRKAARALDEARGDNERRQAYWQLHQINEALGVPMPTMQAVGVPPLTLPASGAAAPTNEEAAP